MCVCAVAPSARAVMAAAKQEQPTLVQRAGAGLASLGMAATLMCGAPAIAGEFDIINTVSLVSWFICSSSHHPLDQRPSRMKCGEQNNSLSSQLTAHTHTHTGQAAMQLQCSIPAPLLHRACSPAAA